ncbi:hypothetical protein [Gracilimonas mengyeensis]|uniref:Uncharacterized protein n=1 Tax=Gracilimonas mengyeensis TaxID=1302730 RepID=A0A521CQG9_9BACT|nr:hypothetical protein [Gracilimonas mengyeensis]SMO61683.1 hypothetical protein SAMN06265219_10663 [Gracilimonas mengyeensis]
MNDVFKNIFISLGIAFILVAIQTSVNSEYLNEFLKNNLITLLVALLAINSATLGIILTKLRDLIDKNSSANFLQTKNEMLLSIKEQIGLIAFSVVVMLLKYSHLYNSICIKDYFIDTIIIGIFVYAILILYDTAKSVFLLLDL